MATSVRDVAQLPPGLRLAVRELLDLAFEGQFTEDDWVHALGGTHVVVGVDRILVAHASVVPRVLLVGDQEVRTGYVEAVATHPVFQQRGFGTLAMERVAAIIADKCELGVLSTSSPAFYSRLGWEVWRGPTYCDTPTGRLRTEDDDGGVMVLRTSRSGALDLASSITCDFRSGDVW